jgi:hypothetical protein
MSRPDALVSGDQAPWENPRFPSNFTMRSHGCGDLRADHAGQDVQLSSVPWSGVTQEEQPLRSRG